MKADGLLRIHTDKRIFFGTKIFDRKEIEELLLPHHALSTMFVTVRVYICSYSCTLLKSQTWFPSIEINCSVCCSFSITLKYFYSLMLIKTTLDALLPFYKIHFSTSDLFSIFILKSVCQFWRNILFEAISAFSAINVFSQQSKVLINSRPFKIPNNLEVYKPLYKKERFKGAFSFWKLMPLLLSRWCSQTLQKFHQRENYIKIILQTQTILTPHLRILYFHLTTSYIRQLKVICDVCKECRFHNFQPISQFSSDFTMCWPNSTVSPNFRI